MEFEIFLTALPGLEPVLAEEAQALGLGPCRVEAGGVTIRGGWPAVWRAHLGLRTAGRVLVRVAEFRAMHLAQLDKRSRKLDWPALLPKGRALSVEATCRRSKIYHDRAAAQRIGTAAREAMGAPEKPAEGEEPLKILARIEDDLVTLSLDASGAPLHRRGLKQAVGKAPLRETMAAAFLMQMGYDGTQPVLDPMCGSGTFPIEAAEIAAGLLPGRARDFGFQAFPSFDARAFEALKVEMTRAAPEVLPAFRGSDRDQGAVASATANAARAGLGEAVLFERKAVSEIVPPEGPPGLVMVNPPYGGRIGNKKMLYGLYAALGGVLKERFAGWRLGLVTSEPGLAKAVGIPLQPAGPSVPHGGLSVSLWQSGPL
ncbi:THUMP domain-containing class I SAM-dependent RNA methyltransferase [Pseudoroseicyclus aestuarii]|uniref:Putative N6-adenine-specific DNA methylase n=1 Tax=Pseudoroseicyclus aestuarii TaxID=1795041 RepID=A0A318SQJ4_9RHOB|nr:class I SAM-dependent RNA methyltransferase [Pseudoroseicyclus aestuarii]PYE83952.1 putative N6-adenine-specific DNA methylase [Pseudoroseicyclus aestuarii]